MRGKELPLLDIHGLPGLGHRADEVGLAAEERGRLEDIHDTGHFGDFRLGVDVCQHRNADRLTDLLEDREALFDPDPAEARGGRTVRLIETRLEDVGDPEFLRDLLHAERDIEAERFALNHAGTCDQKERAVNADFKSAELHSAFSSAAALRSRSAMAAFT